jgi:hypothetical protein
LAGSRMSHPAIHFPLPAGHRHNLIIRMLQSRNHNFSCSRVSNPESAGKL